MGATAAGFPCRPVLGDIAAAHRCIQAGIQGDGAAEWQALLAAILLQEEPLEWAQGGPLRLPRTGGTRGVA